MQFFDGAEVQGKIKELLLKAESIQIAVAYWGTGSIEQLGLDNKALKRKKVQIVCDLMSGGCNPEPIKRLRKTFGKARVLTLDRLHAKVWLTETGAVIGSSNASANGLGFEGGETRGLIEGNLFVQDEAVLASIGTWFNHTILPPNARIITDEDLNVAKVLWKRRRKSRPVPKGKSILEALKSDPDAFADRNIFVWVWQPLNMAQWAKDARTAVQNERHDSTIDAWQNVEEAPPPGSYVMDFHIDPRGGVTYGGFYQVLSENHIVNVPGEGTLLLCIPVKKLDTLAVGARNIWIAAAQRARETGQDGEWEGDIATFARKFLK